MKCPDCGAEMKPLAYSVYCPNDCDRIPELIDPEKTEKIIYFTPPSESLSSVTDEDLDKWWDSLNWDTD